MGNETADDWKRIIFEDVPEPNSLPFDLSAKQVDICPLNLSAKPVDLSASRLRYSASQPTETQLVNLSSGNAPTPSATLNLPSAGVLRVKFQFL
jgi:hypothetical protein